MSGSRTGKQDYQTLKKNKRINTGTKYTIFIWRTCNSMELRQRMLDSISYCMVRTFLGQKLERDQDIHRLK